MSELVRLNDVVVIERENVPDVLKAAGAALDAISAIHNVPKRKLCIVKIGGMPASKADMTARRPTLTLTPTQNIRV